MFNLFYIILRKQSNEEGTQNTSSCTGRCFVCVSNILRRGKSSITILFTTTFKSVVFGIGVTYDFSLATVNIMATFSKINRIGFFVPDKHSQRNFFNGRSIYWLIIGVTWMGMSTACSFSKYRKAMLCLARKMLRRGYRFLKLE